MKLIPLILSLSLSANAAMVRVVSIDDARSIIIEHDGIREQIRLAGVDITDEKHAQDLLRWTLSSSWVMVEKQPDGGHFVWRSPDALFINRELVLRGYARATAFGIEPQPTVIVTYLGEIDPPLIAPKARGSYSGTDRRSTAPPSRRTRRSPRSASSKDRSAGPASSPAAPAGGTSARHPRQ